MNLVWPPRRRKGNDFESWPHERGACRNAAISATTPEGAEIPGRFGDATYGCPHQRALVPTFQPQGMKINSPTKRQSGATTGAPATNPACSRMPPFTENHDIGGVPPGQHIDEISRLGGDHFEWSACTPAITAAPRARVMIPDGLTMASCDSVARASPSQTRAPDPRRVDRARCKAGSTGASRRAARWRKWYQSLRSRS